MTDATVPALRFDINGQPDENYTVEEATRFLPIPKPVPVELLGQLGKDCSMVCRIHGLAWTERPTPDKSWGKERAYPFAVIQEVFRLNPATSPYLPRSAA